ncbi:MAG TPA: hypothetical protein VN934_11945 [Candidatus Tumulicola sp.]|nr:hypothetical protein [Candidatus Tumulicola sp.]
MTHPVRNTALAAGMFLSCLIAVAAQSMAAVPSALLPPVGASQTFTASIHFDRPSGAAFSPKPEPQESGGNSTDKKETNERGGAERGFRHDQSGTLTIKRSSQDAIQVSSGGALDSFNASYPVNPTSAAPGSKPNPFVQAVYNALALAPNSPNQLRAGDEWNASIPIHAGRNSHGALPIKVKVISVNGNSAKLEGTGSQTLTFTSPRGQRQADVSATIAMTLVGGRLNAYTEKVSRTMHGQAGSFTTSNTTMLTSP